MPAWISVYCTQPIDDVTAEALAAGVLNNDYHTLAEDYDAGPEEVTPALEAFRLTPDGSGFELHYQSEEDARPIVVHHWTEPGRVAEEVEEVIDSRHSHVARVREHMPRVVAVVGIELGFGQLHDMGLVFAYELARWYGQHKGGLICGDDDNWSRIEDGGYTFL